MNKYYIYILLDSLKPGIYIYDDIKLDFQPFYVGKGTGNRIKSSTMDRESPFKINKIRKIIRLGGDIISVKLYDNLENEESLKMEKLVISKIGRRDLGMGPLTNQTDGGDGRLNSKHTEETKTKISKTKKSQNLKPIVSDLIKEHLSSINKGELNPMWGKSHSYLTKEEQSIRASGTNHPMFGKTHSLLTISKIKRNRRIDQSLLNNISRSRNIKSVLQFTISGDLISEFPSIKEASDKTGCSQSVISKSCRGVIKKPRRFIFKFKDDSSKILDNSYVVKIGETFKIDGYDYKLLKRSKISCVVSIGDSIFTFRKTDYSFIWEKRKC